MHTDCDLGIDLVATFDLAPGADVRAGAAVAVLRAAFGHGVRLLVGQSKPSALVAFLPARLLPGWLAAALPLGRPEPILGGRLGTVAAVHVEAALQFGNALGLLGNDGLEFHDFLFQLLDILPFFLCHHLRRLLSPFPIISYVLPFFLRGY